MVEEAIIDFVPFRSVGDLGAGRGEVAMGFTHGHLRGQAGGAHLCFCNQAEHQ